MATSISNGTVGGDELSRRKQEIVTVSMALFAQRGYLATSVREIADAVGMLSGSLYSHFASKEDILDGGLRPYIVESLARNREFAALSAPPVEKVRLMLAQAVEGIANSPNAAATLHQDWDYVSAQARYADARRLRQQFDGTLLQSLEEAQKNGELAHDIDCNVVVHLVRAMLGGVVQRFLSDHPYPAPVLTDHMHRMIFGGLHHPARTTLV